LGWHVVLHETHTQKNVRLLQKKKFYLHFFLLKHTQNLKTKKKLRGKNSTHFIR